MVELSIVFYARVLSTVASTGLFFLMLSRARDRTKKFFTFAMMFVSLWNLFELVMTVLPATMLVEARLLLILVLMCVVGAASSISLFSMELTYAKLNNLGMSISLVPLLMIPVIALFTPNVEYTVHGFASRYDLGFILLFGGISAVPVLYATYNLASLFTKLSGKLKSQMTMFIVGLLTMLLSAEVVDVFLHTLYDLPALGSVGVFIGSLIMIVPFLEK